MFRRVVRIDAGGGRLLIVRVEKGLSAQGGRMWPDSQTAPELIDVRLVELPELLAAERQLAAYNPGWRPRPELVRRSPAVGAPTGNAVVSPSSGRTESRSCFRVAQATYADTLRDATAMTTPQDAR